MAEQKIRGWRVWSVQCDLADGKSQSDIAQKYGVTQQSVSQFAIKHAEKIEELRSRTRAIGEGLWIADKQARIGAYQETAERVEALLDAEVEPADDDDERGKRRRSTGGVPLAELLRTQQAAYRAVAEELGDLPQRIKVEGGGEPVRHVIEGVDINDLT